MPCGTLEKVVNSETGEVLTVVQLEVTNPYIVILKEENGTLVKLAVDLLVCPICKSRVYAQSIDCLLCESYLKGVYERTGKTSDVLWNGSWDAATHRVTDHRMDGR